VARRILTECIENELSLPQAIIVAREQLAGRGRNARTWSSPAGKGIYATVLLTRSSEEMALVPLAVASIVANFLRKRFGIEAGLKWPNDVLADGRKIAGILIEARTQDHGAYMLIGIGVNAEPVEDESRPNATTIRQAAKHGYDGLDAAIVAFIEDVDAGLSLPLTRESVLREWRRLTVHRIGDRVSSVVGERTIEGEWAGIDDYGRALVKAGGKTIAVAAGDVIVRPVAG
jgi:BirA family biotin operon repressor/biotin-[acetyl-CoA-carboxylase] ligase